MEVALGVHTPACAVVIPWRGFRCFTLEDVFVFEFEIDDEL